MNLDGKLNPAALRALAADCFESYLDQEGIGFVVDWPALIRPALGDALASGR